MSTITRNYEYDGQPVKPESPEAWAAANTEVRKAEAILRDILPLIPEAVRGDYDKAVKAVAKATTPLGRVCSEFQRTSKHFEPEEAWVKALSEARWHGAIK